MRPQPFVDFCASYDFVLTPAQRVLTMVCFDGVEPRDLPPEDRALATTLFGPIDEVPETAREAIVWLKGARIGGTRMAAMRVYQLGLTVELGLAAGESAFGLFIGPDMRLAAQAFGYVVGAVQHDAKEGRIELRRKGKKSLAITRYDGEVVTYECLPATKGGSAVRARTLVAAQMTEGAFFRDANFAVNDAEIFRALAPRIVVGGQLIVESTPWTMSGIVYELHTANHSHPTTALAAHCPTTLMRPDDRMAAIIAGERARDPENAAREFDAEFIAGGATALFEPLTIEAAVDDTRGAVTERPRGAGVGCGGDTGLVNDASALAIVARIPGQRISEDTRRPDRFELLELREFRPKKGEPLKLSAVIEDFAGTVIRHGERSFLADAHVREPAREFARKHEVTIGEAPVKTEEIWESFSFLAKLIREGRFTMPRHPRLIAQLRAVVSKPVAGGLYKVSMPRRSGSGHGDLVSALVLAVWDARHRGGSRGSPIRSSGGDRSRWADMPGRGF